MSRLALALIGLVVVAALRAEEPKIPRIAALVSTYYHNSHADVIVGRILEGRGLDHQPPVPKLKLAALYTDQLPKNDKSRALAAKHGFTIYPSIREALTLGGDALAVDGVLLIAEHGEYPRSALGQFVYPKRKWFAEIAKLVEASGRPVPVFCDKHLADTWEDAKWMADEAKRLKMPLMAGSSLPGLWRYPPRDVPRGAKLKEIVAVSYHLLDVYGFHALEMVQCLAERRAGGETGVAAVQCLSGDEVWKAGERGVYDRRLLDAALGRLKDRPIPKDKTLPELVKEPVLFVIDYRDGLRASVLTLNYAVSEWSVAWRQADDSVDSTLFWTQEARPFAHFAILFDGIEKMMHTGQASWPAERTLLTSGTLDFLLRSKKEQGRRLETPQLAVEYKSDWNWSEPPPPPPGRPIPEQ